MDRRYWIVVLAWLVGTLVFAGCAATSRVFFESEPPGAAVVVNNEHMGRTPIKVPIKVKDEALSVMIELPGYDPELVTLTRVLEKKKLAYGAMAVIAVGLSSLFVEQEGALPAAAGVGAGTVAVILSAATGSMDTYKPSKVNVVLSKTKREGEAVKKSQR